MSGSMRAVTLLLSASLACFATGAEAAARRIALAPPQTEVTFRAYGLGLVPLDGRVALFSGWLIYDPDHHDSRPVDLSADVPSLAMQDASVREAVVGHDFMDAPRFPTLLYAG